MENNQNTGGEQLMATFNLSELSRQIKREESWEKTGRSAKTLSKRGGLRLVLNAMKAGTQIKPHQANGPISVHCLEGKLVFRTEDENVSLGPGEMLSLKEHIRHSVEAVDETTFLLTIGSLDPQGN